jgi:hypothetical protein
MKKFKTLLASSNHPESLGYKFRKDRFRIFEKFLELNFPNDKQVKILDIGGASYFWADKDLLQNKRIKVTLLNLQQERNLPEGIDSLVGDATDLSDYADKSVDLVFSNSVIEHLYTFDNQRKMAAEIMRVGRFYFVQTPNRHFFLEPHYAVPFIQYIPTNMALWLLTKTKISRLQRWTHEAAFQYLEEIRLITLKEYRQLFPKAQIYKERFLGMSKSFIAHNSNYPLINRK